MSATASPLDLLCTVASHQEKLPSPHSDAHSQSPLADSATLLATPQIIPEAPASPMDHDNEDKDGSSASPTDPPTKARRRPSKAKLARSPSELVDEVPHELSLQGRERASVRLAARNSVSDTPTNDQKKPPSRPSPPRGTRHAKRPSTQLDDGDVDYTETTKRKHHSKKRRISTAEPERPPTPRGWQSLSPMNEHCPRSTNKPHSVLSIPTSKAHDSQEPVSFEVTPAVPIEAPPPVSQTGEESGKPPKITRRKRTREESHINEATSVSELSTRKDQTQAKERSPRKKIRREALAKPGEIVLQPKYCLQRHYVDLGKCLACIRKVAGSPCRFAGLRSFKINQVGIPEGPPIWAPKQISSSSFVYPTSFSVPLSTEHITRVKSTVASALLPTLRQELQLLEENKEFEPLRRERETDVRVTCDACMTSILAATMFCTQCGQEYCGACFDKFKRESINLREIKTTPKLLRCFRTDTVHSTKQFYPMSRFAQGKLEEAIKEMESLLEQSPVEVLPPVLEALKPLKERLKRLNKATDMGCAQLELESDPELRTEVPSSIPSACDSSPAYDTSYLLSSASSTSGPSTPPLLTPRDPESITLKTELPTQAPPPAPFPLNPTHASVHKHTEGPADPSGVDSHHYSVCHYSELTNALFQTIWANGETLVVTGLRDKLKCPWTPEWFIEQYGEQQCYITDCVTEKTHVSHVRDFFSQFGNWAGREGKILKLKDWPPQNDFRKSFPELFDDFQNAVPAPIYTRRDGPLNISAHFPSNAIGPDLGPKMYNAFASNEGEGGFGSTRLHMDMADAVNIMLYAVDEHGQEGVAAWDIFRSQDSNAIRDFLRKEFPPGRYRYTDPIHSQHFFLTTGLRKKLWDEYRVKSWRIYQRPGEAVFIPAGCAHQVCNLADCIKVAVDFVSPENVARCATLTQEFRNENEVVQWKEDVLQLKAMMLHAWQSCKLAENVIR